MRAEFEQTQKFQDAAAWSKDGSRCLSCGRDWNGKWIDLATLSSTARKTLVALYWLLRGDSTLLVARPPDRPAGEYSNDRLERQIAMLVSDFADSDDARFERIGIVADSVLAEWQKETSTREQHDPADTVSSADRSQVTAMARADDQRLKQSEIDLNVLALKAVVEGGLEKALTVAAGATAIQKCNAIMNRLIDNQNDDEIFGWSQDEWIRRLREQGHRFSKKTLAGTVNLETEPQDRRAWARIMQHRRGAKNEYLVSKETAEDIFSSKNTRDS